MSFLDELRNARESAASAFALFLIDYPKYPDYVYAFFEGQDDPSFYNGFILQFLPDPSLLRIYKCGRKAEVYETHRRVMLRATADSKILFFVDKDLSDILDENHPVAGNIYVTDYYSIENFLVSEDMFRRVWFETFNFPVQHGTVDFEKFRAIFRRELERFYSLLLPIMAWTVYLERNGYSPLLSNIELSRIFYLNDDLVLNRTDRAIEEGEITILAQMCRTTSVIVRPDDIDSVMKELSTKDPKIYVRGKFELWFFIKFVSKLGQLLRASMPQVSGSITIRTEITESNAIVFLGPRLRIPSSLDEFLRRNLGMQT